MPLMALIALCLTPAFGSAALLITAVVALVAVPLLFIKRDWSAIRPTYWLAGALFTYFGYFLLVDTAISGDFSASLYTMAPNLPLVAVGVIAMAIDPEQARLSASRIGIWAGLAVVASLGMATVIWLAQPNWQIMGLSLTQISGVNQRLELFAGNPLPFAAAYMTLGFVALLGWHDRSLRSRSLAVAALVIALATVMFWSGSRGATLAAIPLLMLSIWYIRPRPAALLIAALGLAAPIALVMILGGFREHVIRSIEHLTRGLATLATGDPLMESSTGFRLIMYRAGVAAWMESPIWGYGVSQRFSAIIPHLPEGYSFRFTHLHNTFVTHAVAGGAVGVAVLVSLLLTPVAINQTVGASDRDQRFLAWLIFLSMAGVGMSNLILNHDISAHLLALLMLVHLLMHHEKRQTDRSSNQFLSLGGQSAVESVMRGGRG